MFCFSPNISNNVFPCVFISLFSYRQKRLSSGGGGSTSTPACIWGSFTRSLVRSFTGPLSLWCGWHFDNICFVCVLCLYVRIWWVVYVHVGILSIFFCVGCTCVCMCSWYFANFVCVGCLCVRMCSWHFANICLCVLFVYTLIFCHFFLCGLGMCIWHFANICLCVLFVCTYVYLAFCQYLFVCIVCVYLCVVGILLIFVCVCCMCVCICSWHFGNIYLCVCCMCVRICSWHFVNICLCLGLGLDKML